MIVWSVRVIYEGPAALLDAIPGHDETLLTKQGRKGNEVYVALVSLGSPVTKVNMNLK